LSNDSDPPISPVSDASHPISDAASDVLSNESMPLDAIPSETSHESQDSANFSQASFSSAGSQNDVVFLPNILTITSTERCCFLCRRTDRRSVVPDAAVRQAWRKKKVFLSKTTRCCPNHLSEGLFTQVSLNQIQGNVQGIYITTRDVCTWIFELTDATEDKPRVDFADPEDLTTEDYETLLPCSKDAFDEMSFLISPRMRISSNRHPRNALAMFLMMLRLNLTQKFLAFLFRVEQTTVSLAIQTVSDLLLELHTPRHLGYRHLSRDLAIENHSRVLFNELFQRFESLFLIVDGKYNINVSNIFINEFLTCLATYITIEKPGNYEEQRLTFSLDKKKNLYKPTLLVLPDGYILEASEMFFCDARNNDATILKYLFATTELEQYVDEEDVLLVDRGYRDAVKRAEDAGLAVFMPNLLQREGTRRVQFPTNEGNQSRRVTACRWVVESVNGRMKNVFPFFAAKIEAPYKSSISKFFRVACGISNAYHPPIFNNAPEHQEVAQRMLGRMELRNLLQERIEDMGWNTQTRALAWTPANQDTFEDFPRLTLDEIRELTYGPYQIRMAHWYTRQHMSEHGNYEIWVHREAPNLVRAKIHARFAHTDTPHNVWVEFSADRVGIANILGFYCTCKTGARVVGTCSHVTSVNT
jgi:hypothetical protein